jgi:hypothetical protein
LCDSIPDIDRARVLTGALKDVRAFGRQLAQQHLRCLVGTVLAPERAEHADFQVVWIASDCSHDRAILVLGERDGAQRGPVNDGRH